MPKTVDPQDIGIVRYLRRQQRTILLLLDRLDRTSDAEARLVLGELHREVQMQFIVEESVVHPAYREHVPGRQAELLVAEGRVGHDLVDRHFGALYGLDPATPEAARHMQALRRDLDRHIEWQREEVLPALCASCSEGVLEELGARARSKRQALRTSQDVTPPSAF